MHGLSTELSVRFNPRSRGGSDGLIQRHFLRLSIMSVSIRAPAWGATRGLSFPAVFSVHDRVSIRAPAWGATTEGYSDITDWLFQSALPRGERLSSGIHMRNAATFQSALPRGERRAARVS